MNVDTTICNGCGACVVVCESGAIQMVEGCARIDPGLCTDCRACADACPMDAITVALPSIVPAALPVHMPAQFPAQLEPHGTQTRAIAPVLGAALTFLGREVAPRVAAAVAEAVLQRAEHPTRPAQPPPYVPADRPRRLRRRAGRRNRSARD